jgi:pSer/pThr/pTyr-binding forkhead associated (FHA) protein
MALPTGPIRAIKPAVPNFTGGTARLKFSATIYLQIEDSPGLVAIQLLGPATMGRADEEVDAIDVDLIPYKAAAKGVSRRHAVLERHESRSDFNNYRFEQKCG